MGNIIIGTILLACSIQDLAKKKVYMIPVYLGAILLIALQLKMGEFNFLYRALGIIPGVLLIAAGILSKGEIGLADGVVVCLTGLGIGFEKNVILLFYALFLCALFSIVFLILKRFNRRTEIPFIPFLFLGFLGVQLL